MINFLSKQNQIQLPGSEVLTSARTVHSTTSSPRVSTSYYSALPMPIRALIYIPVTAAQTIQQNIFPSILFTEGSHVFRQNFGFSREKLIGGIVLGTLILGSPETIVRNLFLGGMAIVICSQSREKAVNNLFLYGMALCTISKFYINPWFDKEHEAINAIWFKMSDKTISDAEYFESFYATIWEFTKALSALVSTQVLNSIFSSILTQTIIFKREKEFIEGLFSHDSAYGVNATNRSSGSEADNEKANLNPVKLFEDIKDESALVLLWNTRINTLIDGLLACYSLFTMSPLVVLSSYFGIIALPRLLLVSFAYSLTFNTLLSFFEKPAEMLHRKLKQLKDIIIRQITNTYHNALLMTFLAGEKFEANKLLNLAEEQRRQSIKHDLLDSAKGFITNFLDNFQWLFPILATIRDVRVGNLKQEEVGPFMSYYNRLNELITWLKKNFELLDAIMQSIRRLALHEEHLKAWELERVEIEKKVTDSDVISFSGSVFADEKHETLLAHGSFILEPGSITHFDAPSGSGKTTLFKVFRRIWGNFDGSSPISTTVASEPCTLPKQKTAFLPSQVYVLGTDEPLFQTICYPVNHKKLTSNMSMLQEWLKLLNLPSRIYDNLTSFSFAEDEITNRTIFNWMISLSDGEKRRIAFCNILLKLATQNIEFLILDEPFKDIDIPTQQIMVELLKSVITRFNPQCTVLFSNHGSNHELNTHTLAINEQTKEYHWGLAVS